MELLKKKKYLNCDKIIHTIVKKHYTNMKNYFILKS